MIKALFANLKVGDEVERNNVTWVVLNKVDSEDEKTLSLTYPGFAFPINNVDATAFDMSNFYLMEKKNERKGTD